MKIKIYRYVGSYGAGWVYDTDDKPAYYRSSEDYKYIGEYDLPEELIEEFPYYVE